MAYTVTWTSRAQRQLTEIWIDTKNRREVSEAANRIDQLLRETPGTLGESRSGNQRILFEFPLLVIYDLLEQDLMVRVALVRELAVD